MPTERSGADYGGARGSNAGDQFHELWALGQVLELLRPSTDLEAIAVEGIGHGNAKGDDEPTWDGVDCAMFYGGSTLETAERVVFAQLKYSGSSPNTSWTVARLCANTSTKGNNSVIRRLADDYRDAKARMRKNKAFSTKLVSNQAIGTDFKSVLEAPAKLTDKQKQKLEADRAKVLEASGLNAKDLTAFLSHVDVSECGTASRFAHQEAVVKSAMSLLGDDVGAEVDLLQLQIRNSMLPERAGEHIDLAKLLVWFDIGGRDGLFPCPPEIEIPKRPIWRASGDEVFDRLGAGIRTIVVHGQGGSGKTTLCQQIIQKLPTGSVAVTYDCYGGGTYLHSNDKRHLPERAFLQFTNELAISSGLPVFIPRSATHPATLETFLSRLSLAGRAVAERSAEALVVIVIDAADNAVTAARLAGDECFVHQLAAANFSSLPTNVRFLFSARSARRDGLHLAAGAEVECIPFNVKESLEHLRQTFPAASEGQGEHFKALTDGVPRVQSYALKGSGGSLDVLFQSLLPNGRSLNDVIEASFALASKKLGDPEKFTELLGGIAFLPTPAEVDALAAVASVTVGDVRDFVSDASAGLRQKNDQVTISDEDFEEYVKSKTAPLQQSTTAKIAAHFVASYRTNPYSAAYVVDYLVRAGRVGDVFNVIDDDPDISAISDPVHKREVQIRRLTQALATCRGAGDVRKSLQTVLIGAEAQRDESTFYSLIDEQSDLSVMFSPATVIRRTLLDRDEVYRHGTVMANLALAASMTGDRATAFQYLRHYDAWILKRPTTQDRHDDKTWIVEDSDIAARVEALFLLRGSEAALNELFRWTPKAVRLRVAMLVVPRLVARGRGEQLMAMLVDELAGSPWALVVAVPLAQAGYSVPNAILVNGLRRLRRALVIGDTGRSTYGSSRELAGWHRIIVSAAEICFAANAPVNQLMPPVLLLLEAVAKGRALYSTDTTRIDTINRLWLIERSLSGSTDIGSKAFIEYSKSLKKAEPGDPTKPRPRDEEQERLERRIGGVFSTYEARLKLLKKARSSELKTADFDPLRLPIDRYDLDRDYEGMVARQILALSVGELIALPGAPVAALYRSSMQFAMKGATSWIGRQRELITLFRLRTEFHEELLADLTSSSESTRAAIARATDKVDEFVEIARHVLPISEPDARYFFNSAIEIAREIDDEAIDQLAFVAEAVASAHPNGSDEPELASKLAIYASASAIRLDGHDGFSWDDVMSGLVRLHFPTAMACAGRWMDDGTANLWRTLPRLLSHSFDVGHLDLFEATAWCALSDGPSDSLLRNFAGHIHALTADEEGPVVEELARLILTMEPQEGREEPARLLLSAVASETTGFWIESLRQLVSFLRRRPARSDPSLGGLFPKKEENVEAMKPQPLPRLERGVPPTKLALETAIRLARSSQKYISSTAVLEQLSGDVAVGDRVAFLDSLTSIDHELATPYDWSWLLVRLLDKWTSPAVRSWRRTKLGGVISKNLFDLCHNIRYGNQQLDALILATEADPASVVEILLDGVASTGTDMSGAALFAISKRLVTQLTIGDADATIAWYLTRLVNRVPESDRGELSPRDVPSSNDLAKSRFLYALLSDIDTRFRWRAGHAVRMLARLGMNDLVADVLAQYGRSTEGAFRDPKSPFYDLGARMWTLLVALRLSSEAPTAVLSFVDQLVDAATSITLPHVAMREYAKRTLLNLLSSSHLSLDEPLLSRVHGANQPKKRARPNTQRNPHAFRSPRNRDRSSRRYSFDEMDTIPYWYSNVLHMFPTVTLDKMLSMAERWILDVWDAPIDAQKWVREPRRQTRLDDRSFGDWSHSHGSLPTVERYSTYLEFHAMLCVAGELLEVSPLGAPEYGEDLLDDWIRRFLPTMEGVWVADIRQPTPLAESLWWEDARTDEAWRDDISDQEFVDWLKIGSHDSWIVVDSYISSDHATRDETISVGSALVSPKTAASYAAAMQTVSNKWDFGVPDEGDDNLEIDSPPFRLVGWLVSPSGELQFDEYDPVRFETRQVRTCPGPTIVQALGLRLKGETEWVCDAYDGPVFRYIAWCDEKSPEQETLRKAKSDGHVLLARADVVANYLAENDMCLAYKIGIDREVKKAYSRSYDPDAKRNQHHKVLILSWDGTYRDFRGHAGTWKASG